MPMPELRADGERVWVRTVTASDLPGFERAAALSRQRVAVWNPIDPRDLGWAAQRQNETFRTFLIHARDPRGGHDLVGKVNVFNIVFGRFMSGTIGYDSFDPYAGTGLFAEGLRLVLDLCFAPAPHGLGLHRIEANVQPRNTTSAGLLRSLGFRRERQVRRMLFLSGDGRPDSWRDHDSYAITADERLTPHGSHELPRIVVLVDGAPDDKFGRELATELAVPLLSESVVADVLGTDPTTPGGHDTAQTLLWRQLADSSVGAVVSTIVEPGDAVRIRRGLESAGVDPGSVLRVACGGRVAERLDLGPSVRLEGGCAVAARDVTRIALAARAASAR